MRERLAAEQAMLLSALLVENRPAPPGFAPEQMRAQQASLLAKRRRLVARQCPNLAERLGERFAPLFNAYASAHPPRIGHRPDRDARRFSRWLFRHGEFPRRRRWFRR
jgi:hypothetical protein